MGKTSDEAEQILTQLGLKASLSAQESQDQPEGQVLAQDPQPGKVDVGRTVVLTVSAGKGTVAVPNVANLDQVTAAAQLSAAGLGVKTTQEANDTIPAGKVIRTLPPAGQTVPKGTEVTMVVSSGAEQIPVPAVEGKTEADARNALQAAGFLQRVVYQDVPFNSTQDGKVISQAPAPGTPLPKGETVSLVVGKAVPPPTTTTTNPPSTTEKPTTTT